MSPCPQVQIIQLGIGRAAFVDAFVPLFIDGDMAMGALGGAFTVGGTAGILKCIKVMVLFRHRPQINASLKRQVRGIIKFHAANVGVLHHCGQSDMSKNMGVQEHGDQSVLVGMPLPVGSRLCDQRMGLGLPARVTLSAMV